MDADVWLHFTSGDPDGPPAVGRTGSEACVLLTVGVPSAAAVDDQVIEDLLAQGAELIELCGAFGPAESARVMEQVASRVPVGFVTHPYPEAGGLHGLFG